MSSNGALADLIQAIAYDRDHPALTADHQARTVTVSRSRGAGGRAVAEGLAAALDLPIYDREILNAVADETGIGPSIREKLDECTDGIKGAWLRSLLTGENLFKDSYRRNLVNAMLSIAGDGGIIVGRGGHLVLAHRPVYRVRVTGSAERCAERIAATEGLPPDEALQLFHTIEHQRSRFLRTFYGVDIDDPLTYDLVLNSDRQEIEAMVRIVLAGLNAADGG